MMTKHDRYVFSRVILFIMWSLLNLVRLMGSADHAFYMELKDEWGDLSSAVQSWGARP
jgi:hypothetical protein